MATIKFHDIEVEYDAAAVHNWTVQRRIARGGNDFFEAFDAILCGKADEVAEKLGGTVEVMGELSSAIGDAEGPDAKN